MYYMNYQLIMKKIVIILDLNLNLIKDNKKCKIFIYVFLELDGLIYRIYCQKYRWLVIIFLLKFWNYLEIIRINCLINKNLRLLGCWIRRAGLSIWQEMVIQSIIIISMLMQMQMLIDHQSIIM